MEKRIGGWLKQGFGRKLRALHAWNGWIALFLAVSGILLYIPPLRGLLGAGRVWLKQLHIGAGLASFLVLILYLPLIRKHLRQLREKRGQLGNLAFVLLLTAGWIVSGIVLWRFQSFPPIWSNTALFVHDTFTWVGVPYAVYHSVSRSRWIRTSDRARRTDDPFPREKPREIGVYQPGGGRMMSLLTRRAFLRIGLGTLLAAIAGPLFYRWLRSSAGGSGVSVASIPALPTDGGMQPAPVPLPDSLPPRGGGAKGSFRIYTVTEMPIFTADNWTFQVDGMVDRPNRWNWESFLRMSRDNQVSDFHCVTGWSVYNCTWEGIPLARMLEEAGVQPGATAVKCYSGDGVYTDALTLEQAGMPDVMVAVLLDGKPIPPELGGPVRLIVPKMYAYKSVKWLNRIELIDHDHTGYWEERGYSANAWVKT